MRLTPKTLDIPGDDPFKFDLLERKPLADALTELLSSTPEGFVLALNGSWGSGKTTFLEMWVAKLKKDGYRALYFNAWKNDFSDDPLVALISELETGLRESEGKGSSQTELSKSVVKAKEIGKKLLRRTVPVAVKVVTAGALDIDKVYEEALSEYGKTLAEESFKAYDESKKSIEGFRKAIADVAVKVYEKDHHDQKKPLIFVVDELDRCRPTYSIRVLECVKHLFAVQGVVFVLAIDHNQLAHAVRGTYGEGMDSVGYLRRFFDIQLSLPYADGRNFIQAQFDRYGLDQAFMDRRSVRENARDKEYLLAAFEHLFKCFGCSLRDQERAFGLLSFALRITPKNSYLHPDLLAMLIIVKLKDPALYELFVSRLATPEQLLTRIKSGPGGPAFLGSDNGVILEAMLYAAIATNDERNDVFQRFSAKLSATRDAIEKARLERIIEYISSHEFFKVFGCLNYLIKKIDLASNVPY